MSVNVIPGRTTAGAEGDVVVFLIGMRVNKLWALHKWLPVFAAMPRMLKELSRDKGSGLLSYQLLAGSPRIYTVVQYWESKEKLLAYASAQDKEHRPAWTAFNRRSRGGGEHVGMWHETYVVPAGSYESIYANMPPSGLGKAGGVIPVGHRGERAAQRLAAGSGMRPAS